MHQAEYQPANLVSAPASAGATAGRSLQAMRHRLARATGVGQQRRGLNPQVDLLGVTRAMLAGPVQSSAATIQAGGECRHRPGSSRQLSRFHGGLPLRCRSLRCRSVAPLSPSPMGFIKFCFGLVAGWILPNMVSESGGSSEAPRQQTMTSSTFAARLADLQRRSDATDKAAAITLQELKDQGQQLADAMARLAVAMDR